MLVSMYYKCYVHSYVHICSYKSSVLIIIIRTYVHNNLYCYYIDNNIAFPPSATQSVESGEDNHSELLYIATKVGLNYSLTVTI